MYRSLVWELQQKLLPKSAQSLQSGQTLVLIIDGADRLVDQHGQLISDWIPKTLPRVSGRRRWGWDAVGWRGTSPTWSSFFSLLFAQISQWVHLVLSMSSDVSLGETLEQSQGAHVVALGPLAPSARAQLVREELALYGKRLEESPFNNQVGLSPGLVVVWGESGS